jgi:nucleotide-binding universal stress UspA family protein
MMASHRNYLGDKLQMVERAREDGYFRQLDHAIIAKMREQSAQQEVPEAPPSLNPFTPILVPVDFSDYSTQALERAADIAGRFDSSVVVLHVITAETGVQVLASRLGKYSADLPGPEADDEQEVSDKDIETAIDPHREQAYEALQAFLPSPLADHAVELRVVFGRPFERILETALAAEAGLIVMGTHGRTGLERLAVGSVAERVIRLAPCPVLTLKAPTAESGGWLKDFYASFLQFRT